MRPAALPVTAVGAHSEEFRFSLLSELPQRSCPGLTVCSQLGAALTSWPGFPMNPGQTDGTPGSCGAVAQGGGRDTCT